MGKERKKNEIGVGQSEGASEEVVAESSTMKKDKKKKKSREDKDNFSGEDVEIAARGSEKLGEDALVKKKSEKERVNSEAADGAERKSKKKTKEKMVDSEIDDDGGRKSKKENKEKRSDSEADDDGVKKSTKENKQVSAESEADDNGGKKSKKKSKKESGGDEKALVNTDDAEGKTGKRKRDLGAEENTDKSNKEMKRKSKKKKPSVDSEVEGNNKDSAKDAEEKPSEGSESEGNDLNSVKDAKKKGKKKKQSGEPEAEENNKDSTQDAKKKGKKKQSEDSEAEGDNDDGAKDAKKKRKKKQNSSKSDEDVTTPSSKSAKKVKFSDQVEVFPTEDGESDEESEEESEEEKVELVRGKRFTKEEDELIKKAVYEYIENHALGDEGLKMVLDCKSHPQIRGCWKEITAALPWRPHYGVYHRAHTVFESGSKGIWTKEDLARVIEYHKKNGSDWKPLADAMGKHRKHVKDAWRRIRLASKKKGHWSREEYQTLFDLVNKDLRMKAFQEKRQKHGMLRDNIPWMVISDQLGTRDHVFCCNKWYDQLTSPMVAKGIWANVDDYRLLEELTNLDAACVDDVDWDNLLDNRDGEACRKRWDQMVHHIGLPGTKTFAEEVEILSQRYCPDLAEDREDFDNRPFDPED